MNLRFTRLFDQMDCGPACIRMVTSAYGKDYPQELVDEKGRTCSQKMVS